MLRESIIFIYKRPIQIDTATFPSCSCIFFTISSISIVFLYLFHHFIYKYRVEPLFSPLQRYSIYPLSLSYTLDVFEFQPCFYYTFDDNSQSTLQVCIISISKRPTLLNTATFPPCSCIFFTISSLSIVLSLLFLHCSLIPYVL